MNFIQKCSAVCAYCENNWRSMETLESVNRAGLLEINVQFTVAIAAT